MSVRRERLFEEAAPPPESELAKREALARAEETENASRVETLSDLRESDGWRTLEREILRMRDLALEVVVSPGRTIDDIRFAQGTLDALGKIVLYVEKGDTR